MKLICRILMLFLLINLISCKILSNDKNRQLAKDINQTIKTEDIFFESDGIHLSGTIVIPKNPNSAVVVIHGSDQVPRMLKFAEQLAEKNIMVLTYDKRGVGKSGGIYAGPEVGTNNISVENLNLLAKDANAAVNILFQKNKNLPIGLIGASQAGWIIPIVAQKNPLVKFMVLMSSPTITTLEQLRFQFYTNGREDFWDNHTEKDAREHIKNDPDKYQFVATDPKESLKTISIPGLWIYGEKDIQIPVKMCIEQLNAFKLENKPFEYVLFPALGHHTNLPEPITISANWIKQKVAEIKIKNNTN